MEIVRIVRSLWTWHEAGSRITWQYRLWDFFSRTKIKSICCNVSEKTVMNRSKDAVEGQGRSEIEESRHACKRLLNYFSFLRPAGHPCRTAPRWLFWIVYKNDVAASWPLAFKMWLALQPVLVLCLFWVQKRNLADLKFGDRVSKLTLDLDLNFY